MGLPKTVRMDDDLESLIKEYLRQNNIRFAQLVQLAIAKFICEHQAIELKPIHSKKWKKTVEKAYKKHKDAMDKLK
ncbi:MAG: hypothetical protein HYS98_03815 [Deltaproteobacteria bacterium]|nr:hypothetical protein [Deltaproteobacteria bacterium]